MVWRDNQVFESMTLYSEGGPGANLGSGDRPEQVKLLRTSEGFFRVFGVAPQIGRGLHGIGGRAERTEGRGDQQQPVAIAFRRRSVTGGARRCC